MRCEICGAPLAEAERNDQMMAHRLHDEVVDADVETSLEPHALALRLVQLVRCVSALMCIGWNFSTCVCIYVFLHLFIAPMHSPIYKTKYI